MLTSALDRRRRECRGRDALADRLALVFPGVVAASWMVMTATNAGLAQGVLARFGASWRPSPDLAALTLPLWLPVVLAFAAAATAFGGGAVCRRQCDDRAGVPFCLAGLAVLHALARRLVAPGGLCSSTFYVLAGVRLAATG